MTAPAFAPALESTTAEPRPARRPRGGFRATLHLELAEALRAKWFLFYALVFFGLVITMLVTGLTDSRVMGFTGLSRLLVVYTQLAMAILPVFVLVSTVRSLAGDREAGVFEYILALPISIGAWYAGRLAGRFIATALPVLGAALFAVAVGAARGAPIPWTELLFELSLLVALVWCFVGLGFFISAVSRSVDTAQTAAFVLWLALVLALDLILLGLLIREQVPAETVVTLALANPLQVFRTASMLIFDPQFVLLGPTAYVILDLFGRVGFLVYAFAYPIALGALAALAGHAILKHADLP
jgi:ABC-2 type transport system permease protein